MFGVWGTSKRAIIIQYSKFCGEAVLNSHGATFMDDCDLDLAFLIFLCGTTWANPLNPSQVLQSRCLESARNARSACVRQINIWEVTMFRNHVYERAWRFVREAKHLRLTRDVCGFFEPDFLDTAADLYPNPTTLAVLPLELNAQAQGHWCVYGR